MSELNIHYCVENQNDFPKLPLFASWPGTMISGSNYPFLKLMSMVPRMFEPFKFDCI